MANKLTETDGVAEQYIVDLAISKQELLSTIEVMPAKFQL